MATSLRPDSALAAELVQSAKQKDVKELFPRPEGVGVEELIGTGFTYRHDWGNKHGSWKLRLNWGSVNINSMVFVAIGEGAAGGGKFLGDARYTLMNVAPRAGGVDIWVYIDWGSDIRIYVDYLVVNP
jgi:hypothetical protein